MGKKLLSIIYFFPPISGSGVQRPLKFIKYMPMYGYDSVVLTVKNGHNFAYDKSLLKEIPESVKVYRTNSGEMLWLRNIIEKISSKKESTNTNVKTEVSSNKQGLKTKVFNFIDSNFFIPDSKIRWYKYAVRAAKKIIENENIDVIYSSSYPYTVHLIALKLKKQTNLPWIADFRDPWTENVFMTSGQSNSRKLKEEKMEHEVMQFADVVIMASEPVTEIYKKKYPEFKNKIITITNGFDSDDFNTVEQVNSDEFTICYSGIMTEGQDPETFIKAVDRVFKANIGSKKRIKIKFIGLVIDKYKDMLINSEIGSNIEFLPYMHHAEVIKHMMGAQINLMILVDKEESKGVFSGKIFDYIGSQKPILGIMPENGVASNLINNKKIGKSFNHGDVDGVYEFLNEYYNMWVNGEVVNTNSIAKCKEYERKSLTKTLIDAYENIK